MRYTGLVTILMGLVTVCFAAVRYATGGANSADNPLVLGLVLPLAFAAALVVAGTVLCFVGRPRYAVSGTGPEGTSADGPARAGPAHRLHRSPPPTPSTDGRPSTPIGGAEAPRVGNSYRG